MVTFKRFEDIEVWQMSREFSKDVYRITRHDEFSRDYRFVAQIRASSGSIMDNIAEGFERGGNKEFINFLSIAKGSAGECRSQLCRALDQNYLDKTEFKDLYKKAKDISLKIGSLIQYLKNSSLRGVKYI